MTKEALKLALEALEGVLDNSPKVLDASISGGLYEVVQCRDAIIAIKEALAQPEQGQEPVAHLWECIGRWSAYLVNNGKQADCAPPSWLIDAVNNATTPPVRTWVDLTDEEIQAIAKQARSKDHAVTLTNKFLRDKNT